MRFESYSTASTENNIIQDIIRRLLQIYSCACVCVCVCVLEDKNQEPKISNLHYFLSILNFKFSLALIDHVFNH